MVGAKLVRACLDKLVLPKETELDRARVGARAVLVVADRSVHGLGADYRLAPLARRRAEPSFAHFTRTSLARSSPRRWMSSARAAAAGLRAPTGEAGQTREHGLGFLEPDVRDLGAVARVPAQRSPAEPSRVADHQGDELERLGKADESRAP